MAEYGIFRGRRACTCLIAWLPIFERELLRLGVIKERIDIAQLTGGAPQSGGTHTQGGAFDIWQCDPTTIWVARQMGADADWRRTPAQGFALHGHGVLRGCPHNDPARYQIGAVDAGYNGLGYAGRGGRDDGPRPLSKRTWREGIAWAKARQKAAEPVVIVRPAQYNFPDPTKIPGVLGEDRITTGINLVRGVGRPSLIGWNELVGIKGPNNASDWARAVDGGLSSIWLLIKPTLPLNENYISWRDDDFDLVRQYPDKVLPSVHGGRHLTRAVFRHRKSGFIFAVGLVHLVNGAGDDRDVSRQQQGTDAHRYIENVSQLHDDCPYILMGDMNMHHDLKAAIAAGMKRASRWADDTHGDARAATYTAYDKTRPSTNPEKALDHIYFSQDWYVNDWDVLRALTAAGDYVRPRPSDHDPVVAEARPK